MEDYTFKKTQLEWMKNPQAIPTADIFSYQGLTPEQRAKLAKDQKDIASGSVNLYAEKGKRLSSYDQLFTESYGNLPSEEDFKQDNDRARLYHKGAFAFSDTLDNYLDEEKKLLASEEDAVKASKGALKKALASTAKQSATGNTFTNPYLSLTPQLYDYLSKGLASAGLPDDDETVQKMYQFYKTKQVF